VTSHGSTIVREVISSTSSGADVMSALPGLVRQLLDEEAWRKFSGPDGRVVEHETFTAFVAANPPAGIGGKATQLLALCGTDDKLHARVERLLKEEIQPALPGPGKPNHGTTIIRPTPDTASGTVARLKRDDPALAERVVNGEVSAYAAARSKGWKPPRIQVTTPERTAAHLRKHLTPEQCAELARLLTEPVRKSAPAPAESAPEPDKR
jgi:hypothetical protein